jgi:membrane associated rhomboid family serine protease
MGFQDRGYLRADRSTFLPDWTGVATLVVANVAVFVACMLAGDGVRLLDWLALWSDVPREPWRAYGLLTYGFGHQPLGPREPFPWHLVGNMLTLWFFGRAVEDMLGRAEFLRFYFVALVVAGLAWLASVNLFPHGGGPVPLIGASGAVTAVMAAFIWHHPHTTVLIWGVLPVPAWALGLLYVFWDVQGAAAGTSPVAHVAHLAGAAFGLAYAWRGWDLGDLTALPRRLSAAVRGRRMRVVRPDDAVAGPDDAASLQQAVDRILEKISRSGASSLSGAEQETLARASRRLKDRQRAP